MYNEINHFAISYLFVLLCICGLLRKVEIAMLHQCLITNYRIICLFNIVSLYILVMPPSQGDASKISDQKQSNSKAQDATIKQRLIHVDYDLFKVSNI